MVKAAADNGKYCHHVASHQTTHATFSCTSLMFFLFTANTWSSFFLSYSLKYFIASLHQSASSTCSSSGALLVFFFYTYAIEQICIIFLCTTGCMWRTLCDSSLLKESLRFKVQARRRRECLRQVKVWPTQHRRKQQRCERKAERRRRRRRV